MLLLRDAEPHTRRTARGACTALKARAWTAILTLREPFTTRGATTLARASALATICFCAALSAILTTGADELISPEWQAAACGPPLAHILERSGSSNELSHDCLSTTTARSPQNKTRCNVNLNVLCIVGQGWSRDSCPAIHHHCSCKHSCAHKQ
jgi:hypothetical protein